MVKFISKLLKKWALYLVGILALGAGAKYVGGQFVDGAMTKASETFLSPSTYSLEDSPTSETKSSDGFLDKARGSLRMPDGDTNTDEVMLDAVRNAQNYLDQFESSLVERVDTPQDSGMASRELTQGELSEEEARLQAQSAANKKSLSELRAQIDSLAGPRKSEYSKSESR